MEQPKPLNPMVIIGGIAVIAIVMIVLAVMAAQPDKGDGEISLSIGNAPVIGSASAPNTVYVFSDFSCPYCAAAAGQNEEVESTFRQRDASWEPVIPGLLQNEVAQGSTKLVFKYFPGHGAGRAAMEVGWCMNEQDLFWEYHDFAFARQSETGDLEAMKDLAVSIGGDESKLTECLASARYTGQFTQDEQMGSSNGVSGTPTFFVNGQKVEGAQSYGVISKLLN